MTKQPATIDLLTTMSKLSRLGPDNAPVSDFPGPTRLCDPGTLADLGVLIGLDNAPYSCRLLIQAGLSQRRFDLIAAGHPGNRAKGRLVRRASMRPLSSGLLQYSGRFARRAWG